MRTCARDQVQRHIELAIAAVGQAVACPLALATSTGATPAWLANADAVANRLA